MPRLITGSPRATKATLLLAGALLVAACQPPVAAPPPPTRGSTFPAVAPTEAFRVVAPPPGAATPGTSEWYRAPAPGGRDVELGVYRPDPAVENPATVLVLHGGDGLRRRYESLAAGYAARGFIGIVGCWFDDPNQPLDTDAVSCAGGPTFKGTEAAAVQDVDALLAAVGQVEGVDLARLAIVGHSYGAAVTLMRAADDGALQPIVSSSGLLASAPWAVSASPRTGDRYPIDSAGNIDAALMIVHGGGDAITPIGQAEAFVAALADAAKPAPSTEFYPAPAGHSLPWQQDPFPGRSTFAAAFLDDTSGWIAAQLP